MLEEKMLKKILVLKQNQHFQILRAAEFREFLTSPSVVTLRWARHVFVFGGRCCTEFGREYLLRAIELERKGKNK
jgi:hypothetical protein